MREGGKKKRKHVHGVKGGQPLPPLSKRKRKRKWQSESSRSRTKPYRTIYPVAVTKYGGRS